MPTFTTSSYHHGAARRRRFRDTTLYPLRGLMLQAVQPAL